MNFLVMPIFFLSGALFPLSNLPKALSIITSIDPLSYGVDGLRATLIGISYFGTAADLLVLSIVSAALLLLGELPVLENTALALPFSSCRVPADWMPSSLLRGRERTIHHDPLIVGCRVNFATGNNRRHELSKRSQPVAGRILLAVPKLLQRFGIVGI